jgi:nucleoid-associated protein YgaU
MERYREITNISKTDEGKRRYDSLRYPNIEPKSSDIYFYAKKSDRLDLLAHKYYGDVTLWPIIARANRIGKGSLWAEAGKRIRIPYPLSTEEVIESFFEVNERD